MRKALWMASATLLVFSPLTVWSQDQPQAKQEPAPEKQAQPAQQPSKQQQQDALAAAARKAREDKEKKGQKAGVVWTNDNLPKTPGQLSEIGPPAPAGASKSGAAEAVPSGAQPVAQAKEKSGEKKEPVKNEAYWRAKFADSRQALQKAEQELSVMQRELSKLQVEYYPDPQKAMEQQYSRSDIVKKQAAIDAKQKEIEQRKQAISDMEEELRRAGGDPGWASE